MAAVTFATRVPLYVLSRLRVELPRPVELFLHNIPVPAFAAIVFSTVAEPGGTLRLEWSNLYFYAVPVAAAVAWRTRSMSWTIFTSVGFTILLAWITGEY
jgi:branched-subunit amino acid transport protein